MSAVLRTCLEERLSAAFRCVSRGESLAIPYRLGSRRIPLPFPVERRYFLILCESRDLFASECDTERLSRRLCCPDALEVIGFLDVDGTVRSGDRQIVLMGRCGAIYVYNPAPDDGLYRLSEDIWGFVSRGLKRFDAIYEDPRMPLVVRDVDPRLRCLRTRRDLLRYAEDASGSVYEMLWPARYTLTFGAPDVAADTSELLSETQAELAASLRLLAFGHFGSEDAEPAERHALYVSGDGGVYGFRREEYRLLKLGSSFPAFLRMGPVKFFTNHRISGDPVEVALSLPPRCVNGACARG
uniref:M25.2 n=1 Tax=Lemniscomys rat herpesvirus TaxID=3141920 RepID=A0AAU7E166_9VIRU